MGDCSCCALRPVIGVCDSNALSRLHPGRMLLRRGLPQPSPAHNPVPDTGCENRGVSAAKNSDGTARGRPFRPGQSGNPGGRPKGLARATRELVGDDGMPVVELWWDIAQDPMQRTGTGSKPPSSWPTVAGARLLPSNQWRATRSTWLPWRGRRRSSGRRSCGLLRSENGPTPKGRHHPGPSSAAVSGPPSVDSVFAAA